MIYFFSSGINVLARMHVCVWVCLVLVCECICCGGGVLVHALQHTRSSHGIS